MQNHEQIIRLYTELAEHPERDFGWEKGRRNAQAHGYEEEWFEKLPDEIWEYCAAVGNPFRHAQISKGDTVVDLGCGAGVDLMVAALLTGSEGKAIGIDITPKMVAKAKEHALLADFSHVEVYESDFESIPLEDASADVVISNGAINLCACKESLFSEIYRVLKPGGRLFFADMIDISESKPDSEISSCCGGAAAKEDSCSTGSDDAQWANCVAGTLKKEKLMQIMAEAGFGEIECTGLSEYKTSKTTQGATFSAVKIPADERRRAHWEEVYKSKDYTQVLWHQSSPDLSLGLIERAGIGQEDEIIDVGCGASLLCDRLSEKGYRNLTLLDISSASLKIVKERLGSRAEAVEFVCGDVTQFRSEKRFDLWHDRAVFHFLLNESERRDYFKALHQALKEGGIAILNTFSVEGPTMCSGLDIVQYDEQKMRDELISGLELIESREALHHTPKETYQAYRYFILKKS